MTQVREGSGTGGAAIGRRSRMPLGALILALAFALLVPPASGQISGGGTEPGVDSATPVGGSAPSTTPEQPGPTVEPAPVPTQEPAAIPEPASGPIPEPTPAPAPPEPTSAPASERAPEATSPPALSTETAPQPAAPSPQTAEVVQPPTAPPGGPPSPAAQAELPAASEPPPAEAPAPPPAIAPDSSVLALPDPTTDAPAEGLREPVAGSPSGAETPAEAMFREALELIDDLAGVRVAMAMLAAGDDAPAAGVSPSRPDSRPGTEDPSPVPSPDPPPLTGSAPSAAAGGVSSGGGSAALYALLITVAAFARGVWGRLQLVPVRWRSVTIVALNERPG